MKSKALRVGLVLSQLVLFVFLVLGSSPGQAQQAEQPAEQPLVKLKLHRANFIKSLFPPKKMSPALRGGGGGGGLCNQYLYPEEEQEAIAECDDMGGSYNLAGCSCYLDGGGGGGGGGGGLGDYGDQSPVLYGIDPDIWPSGNSTAVTFTGEYFGGNPPQLNFSDPSISYYVTGIDPEQIQAVVSVPSGTPYENVAVSVTSNGFGNGFISGTRNNSPNSGPVTATVITPNTNHQVIGISWVNGNAPDVVNMLNAGPDTSDLSAQLNSSLYCGFIVSKWAGGAATDLNDNQDRGYAMAFMLNHSGNHEPPQTISNVASYQSAKDFRMLNVFGAGANGFTQVGNTPNPCGQLLPPDWQSWLTNAQAYPQSGQAGISDWGNTWQLVEGRVGTIGQLVNWTINQRSTPWTWAVVEFDGYGNPITSNHAVFPTYYFYVDGSRQDQMTWPQAPLTAFTALDEGYYMPSWAIQ